jgi:hypothetical protein
MKQLAGGKHMENNYFPGTLKFEMHPYKGPIRHRKSHLEKVEKHNNEKLAKIFDNINKWINDPLIDNKISNNF